MVPYVPYMRNIKKTTKKSWVIDFKKAGKALTTDYMDI